MNDLLLRTDLTPKQQRFATLVKDSARALLAQITDILDFSKIEAGHLSLEKVEFDLSQKVAEVVALLFEQAHRKSLDLAWRVSSDVPRRVIGDPTRLGQMLTNLVGNAIKFTEQGGVLIEVVCDKDLIRFTVTDSGIGVDPSVIPHLFKPFKQADDSFSRRFGGSGLGLAIVHELADAMHGNAGGEGQPGHGSSFWFAVRLQATTTSTFAPVPDCAGLRMLLASTLPMTSRAITAAALEKGISVQHAADALAALQSLKAASMMQRPIDVIVVATNEALQDTHVIVASAPARSNVICIVPDPHYTGHIPASVALGVNVLNLPLDIQNLFVQAASHRGTAVGRYEDSAT